MCPLSQVECTNCAVLHKCSTCSRVSRDAKRCSSCDKAWYCNQTCQKDDWKRHKPTCQETQDKIVRVATMLRRCYSFSRSLQRLSSFPYYWGNSFAQDLIKIDQNEGEYPDNMAVLLAGVGNLRNVMATVAGLKQSFRGGIHFSLNDTDPQVTARNVFFLYFLWKYREGEGVARKLTQIWYSVKIAEEEAMMAQDCLRELLLLPGDTSTLCDGTVTMAAEQVTQIRPVFQLWLSLLSGERTLKMTPQEQLRRTYQRSADGVDNIIRSIPTRHRASADDWFKTGILLPKSDPRRKFASRDNFTLAAWNPAHNENFSPMLQFPTCSDEVGEIAAGINDDGMPFAEWDYLQVKAKSESDNLLTMYSHYIEDVVKKFADILNRGRLSFHVILSDCLSLNAHLPVDVKFDRIFTSNLADYVSFPVLLDTYRPLLRTSNNRSVIITEFLNFPLYFPEATAADADPFLVIPLFKKAADDLRHEPDWTKRDLTDMVSNTGATSIIEYFNNWDAFTQYLRAALLTHKCPESSHPDLSRKDVPKMSEVTSSCGMKMRNFLRELNTVWPFRHRINVRRVNPLNGHERVLEWTLPDSTELSICEHKAQVGNKIYVIVDESEVTYSQATSTCTSLGGRLASSRYESYQSAYYGIMYENKCGLFNRFRPFWVDVIPDGPGIWRHGVDGTDVAVSYSSWDPHRPVNDPTKRCVRNMATSSSWEVVSCDEPAYFACQFDMEPEDGPDSPCFPTVVLDTGSRPYEKPFRLLRAGNFSTFGRIVDLDCPGDYNITYKWRLRWAVSFDPTVVMDTSQILHRKAGVFLNDVSITIPPNLLFPWKYLLVLSVSMTHGENNDVTTASVSTWIENMPSTLRLLVIGGSKRSQSGGYLMDSDVDAEVHDDSSVVDQQPRANEAGARKWAWACRLPNGSDCGQQIEADSEVGYKAYNKSPRKATLGTFFMRVTHKFRGVQSIPYEQEVTLIPGGLPTCKIICSPGDNCNYQATKFDQRLRLWTKCQIYIIRPWETNGTWYNLTELGPHHSFRWNLKQYPDEFSGDDLENNTLTGLEKSELIVKSNVFTVPGEYIIRLDILTNGTLCTSGSCSYAEWKFSIPVPPANARQPACTADIPVPLSSDFDGQGAIRYEFYYRTTATASVSTMTPSESGHNNLFYYGMSPSPPPFKLPSGLASDDYKVFIFVQIIDQEGTGKTSELELTVRLPTFEDLLTAIDVTNAEVETAIRWGNKMEAVHLSTITAATLNNIRAEGAYGGRDWREARQGIIYNVGRVPIESTESIIQSSESLIQATHYDDQVTADAQVSFCHTTVS
uniref:MYND-type domain-containing protein n=1 Tax=Branchiostoma floridae TaxID=7739 RepID=C3Z834_BRAFL|eukprot:XP_002595336.1 hypothetical protein BRAFLDRAFT_87573 [Branchiostoma floridae]